MSAEVVRLDQHGGAIEPLEVIVKRIKQAITVLSKADDRRAGMAKDLAECKRRVESGDLHPLHAKVLQTQAKPGETPWQTWLRMNFPAASLKYLTNEAALGATADPIAAVAKERARVREAVKKSRETARAVVTVTTPIEPIVASVASNLEDLTECLSAIAAGQTPLEYTKTQVLRLGIKDRTALWKWLGEQLAASLPELHRSLGDAFWAHCKAELGLSDFEATAVMARAGYVMPKLPSTSPKPLTADLPLGIPQRKPAGIEPTAVPL